MKTTLQSNPSENTLSLAIPEEIVRSLDLKANDTLICQVEDGKLILLPAGQPIDYTLDELLAQVIEPSEEIDWGKPEGEEIW